MKLPGTLTLAAALSLGPALSLAPALSPLAIPEASAQSRSSSSVTITSSRGRLGAQVVGITEHLRQYFGAPAHAGLLVDHVLPKSPAAKAGLKTGDVIIKVVDEEISEAWDIFRALGSSKKGDKVNIKVIRNKKPKTLQVILDDDPWSHRAMQWSDLSSPFPHGHEWHPDKIFGHGKDSPFGPMLEGGPWELQEKIRKLEERLDKLEGKKARPKKTPKSTKPSKRLKGAGARPSSQVW